MGKAVLNLLRFTLLQQSTRQGCPRLLSSPSPFGRQKQSCILPCPQGAAPLSPTSNPGWMRRAQHLHHSSPGMLVQALCHHCSDIPFSAPSAHSRRPDTAVPVDSPASRCQPVAGPWGTQSCSRTHQPRDAHTDLLPQAEGSCEPLLPRALLPLPHPTLLLIAVSTSS